MNSTSRTRRFSAVVRRHPWAASAVVLVLAAGIAMGAYFFQPWRLFTTSFLDESLPVPGGTAAGTLTPEGSAPPGASQPSATPAESSPGGSPPGKSPETVVLASGPFQSQEHTTTGTASLLRLPDGSHLVRLENLASSDGPDVKVWLSTEAAGGDWFKYRAGRYVDLGPIKATHGNQNYPVPAGADLTGLGTVVLWCDRFSVAFGSAALS